MTELAKDAGIVNLLNFERRFDPGRERLRALIDDGRDRRAEPLPVLAVHRGAGASLQLALQSGARWRLARGAGIAPDRLLPLALRRDRRGRRGLRTALAERPDAQGQLQRCDADDGFVASLQTATGVTAVIDCSLETPVSTPEKTAVFGSTGMLELDDNGIVLRTRGRRRRDLRSRPAGEGRAGRVDGALGGIRAATRSAAATWSRDGRPSTTGSRARS